MNHFTEYIRRSFSYPDRMNRGFALMVLSLGCSAAFLFRYFYTSLFTIASPTSLAGFSFLTIVCMVLAFLIPFAVTFEHTEGSIAGSYTGIGVIFMSALSGVPLMLINDSLHNLSSWIWLRLGNNMIFPIFLCFSDATDPVSLSLKFICESALPALCMGIFFFGVLWNCFREHNIITYVVTGLFFALSSFNFIDFWGLIFVGAWLCFLRTKTVNIASPIVCYISMKLSSVVFDRYLGRIDITGIQTHSDISSTFLYASVPSFFLGAILLLYFVKQFSEFKNSYNVRDFGKTIMNATQNNTIFTLIKSLNPTYFVAIIIFTVLWILMIKGVML